MPWTLPFDKFKTLAQRRVAQDQWVGGWLDALLEWPTDVFDKLLGDASREVLAFLALYGPKGGNDPYARNRVGVTPFNVELVALYALCTQAYEKVETKVLDGFAELAKEVYQRGCHEVQWDLGKWQSVRELTERQLSQMADAKWFDEKRFSDRLWEDKEALERALRRTLAQGINLGWSAKQMANAIGNALNAALSAIVRLVRTEANRVQNMALMAAYKENGVERYEYVAIMDERTSEICEGLNGKTFLVAEAEPGVNMPPMHPNCRSSTIPLGKDTTNVDRDVERLDYENWVSKYLG